MDSGFSVHPAIITAHECDSLLTELDLLLRVPGHRRLIDNESVKAIAYDPRMVAIAAAYLACEVIPYKSIYFNKTGDTNWLVPWHQDRALPLRRQFDLEDWGPWSIKDGVRFALAPAWALNRVIALRLHIDDSTASNGPLRLIPGSHALGVLDQKEVVNIAARSSIHTCIVSKGGVIAMRPLTIHASSKSVDGRPRRVLHFEYVDSLRLSDEVELSYC